MNDPASVRPEEDVPPWERPGAVRRDREPHRGDFLRFLGLASLINGIVSIYVGPLALAGVPLAYAVCRMARSDLVKMKQGVMDPHGEGETDEARRLAFGGLASSLVAVAVWIVIILASLTFPGMVL